MRQQLDRICPSKLLESAAILDRKMLVKSKAIAKRYVDVINAWGLQFVFAVTQSVEKSEMIVNEAIVSILETEKKERASGAPVRFNSIRFAVLLWDHAHKEAYRGFAADPFFRLPAVARAAVVLKLKAQFSQQQISSILGLKPKLVSDHLENARLLFTGGKSWVSSSTLNAANKVLGLNFGQAASHAPRCMVWNTILQQMNRIDALNEEYQVLFAKYVGRDLDKDLHEALHQHLLSCQSCRQCFSNFKKNYVDWLNSIPRVDLDPETQKGIEKLTKTALKINRTDPPKFVPGIRKVLKERQTQILLSVLVLVLCIHVLFFRR